MNRLIITGFTILIIVLIWQFPHTMINPGELIEGHQELNSDCNSCHAPFWGIDNNRCISCHELSGIGMDSTITDSLEQPVLFHASLKDITCVKCHTDHKGKIPREPISTFKHDLLAMSERQQCVSCHVSPQDELHPLLIDGCGKCHGTEAWEDVAEFNHTLVMIEFKNDCNKCHLSPDDSFHQSVAESNCGSCHTSDAWEPSTFNHDKYFILDHDHNVQCATCHESRDFIEYTCYGCHEHTVSNIQKEHTKEGIFNFTNCASCHASADEDDARRTPSGENGRTQQEVNEMKDFIDQPKKEREHNGEGHDEEEDE